LKFGDVEKDGKVGVVGCGNAISSVSSKVKTWNK